MNLLLDRPPTQIEVGGLFYEIDADFRTGIAFELLMLDEEFTETEKAARAMELYFPQIPDDEEEAMEKILWFYLCGREETNQEEKETEPAPNTMREAFTQRFYRNMGWILWKFHFCIGGSSKPFSMR